MSKKNKKNINQNKDQNNNQNNNSNKPSSSLEQQLKQQLNSKYKIDQRRDVELEVKKPDTIPDLSKNENNKEKKKEKISTFDENQLKEIKDWKLTLKKILFGVSFGACSVVPALSTSSINGNFTFFDNFKEKFRSLISPGNIKNWFLSLLWLLPIFLGALMSFILTFTAIVFISKAGYGPAMVFSCTGIALGICIVYFFVNKLKIPVKKAKFEEVKADLKKPWIIYLLLIVPIILVIVLAIIARFAWNTEFSSGYNLDGISFASDKQIYSYFNIKDHPQLFVKQEFQTNIALLLLASGFFAGFATLIPGLNSAILLSLFGNFSRANWATQVAFSGKLYDANNNVIASLNKDWAWPIIIVLFVGYVLGVVANVLLVSWIKQKSKYDLKVFNFGCMIGSIISVFICLSPIDYNVFATNKNVLACGLALLFIMPILTISIFIVLQKFNIVHLHDKLNFMNKKSNNQETKQN